MFLMFSCKHVGIILYLSPIIPTAGRSASQEIIIQSGNKNKIYDVNQELGI